MKKLSCTVDSKYLDMLWTGSYIYTTYDHPGITTVSYKTTNSFYISLHVNGTKTILHVANIVYNIIAHCRYCNGSTVETFTVLSAMETGQFLGGVAIPFSSPFFIMSNFAEFSKNSSVIPTCTKPFLCTSTKLRLNDTKKTIKFKRICKDVLEMI